MPVWRNAAAWIGLAALAIPLAVHLLARVRAQTVAFPSLRFIHASRLAALKRRTLSDWLLLALRLLALALAVAAFADPLLLTPARRAAWSARISRAIVIDTSPSMTRAATQRQRQPQPQTSTQQEDARRAAEREARDTLESTTMPAPTLREGVERAVAWLRATPPSRREIVCISDFQIDTVDAALLRGVPDDIGLRFVRVGQGRDHESQEQTADARPVTARNGNSNANANGFEWRRAQIRLTETATAVIGRAPVAAATLSPIAIERSDTGFTVAPFGLRVSVANADRPAALAALQAVLAEGVPAPAAAQQDHPIAVLFANADEIKSLAAPTTPASASTRAPAPVSAPWMADVLQAVATDRALAHAIAMATEPPTQSAPDAPQPPQSPWLAVLSDARGVPVLLAATRPRADQPAARELMLLARLAPSAPAAPTLLRAALRALAGADPLPEAEIRTIPDRALNAWTRPAPEPPADAFRNVEGTDRRWLWAAVLAVLLLETWLRRDRARARAHAESVEVHGRAA